MHRKWVFSLVLCAAFGVIVFFSWPYLDTTEEKIGTIIVTILTALGIIYVLYEGAKSLYWCATCRELYYESDKEVRANNSRLRCGHVGERRWH